MPSRPGSIFIFALLHHSLPALRSASWALRDSLRDGTITKERALEIYRNFADIIHINTVMGEIRRAWGPQTGAGSQTSEFDLHKAFADKVSAIAEHEHTKDHDEDYWSGVR